ncbi:RNA-binding protein [Psychrosphaera saromensis]|jgi:RNA-binding protein|uniref:RNA-binding protein n=1 Tax=Psychrosphaera saromensis TaxID=716813 RepID=A0A2S7UW70_9GAMM|nr:ribosome assembly RNA-binding protein YhbY [Psychrosphaera saromensis]PQJ53521.1 RNA-binding protein [Psychrosphaera saromensis]GHB64603.1 RNA-binding protein [Psychrosphaera saromensis]GLQ15725.1 RNA-binding protein [Psychrosphaera saromensis]
MNLSKKQSQFLKGEAHSLKPVVQLGNNGFTEGVLAEIENALAVHELIKVKIPCEDREELKLYVEAIVRESKAEKIQLIGKTLVLFKQSENQKIELPKK